MENKNEARCAYDFFELHDDLRDEKFKFVIRCKWNRSTGKSARSRKNKIIDLLHESSQLGTLRIDSYNSTK